MSRSKNASNGPEAMKSDSLRKKATSPLGRHNQSRGSAESGAKVRKAKTQTRKSSGGDSMDEMEF